MPIHSLKAIINYDEGNSCIYQNLYSTIFSGIASGSISMMLTTLALSVSDRSEEYVSVEIFPDNRE